MSKFQLFLGAPATGGQTVTVNQVSETDTAQTIAWAPKNRLVNQTSEADLAQALTRIKLKALGQALEIDLAQALNRLKTRTLGQTTETDLAQALNRLKAKTLGQTSETDLAQPVIRTGAPIPIGQASETDLAQAIAWAPKRRLINQVFEIDLAQLITLLAADPLHYRCLVAIQAAVRALALTGVPSANVVIRWLPRFQEQLGHVAADPTPLIVIAPLGIETLTPATNDGEDIGYPCLVAIYDGDPDLTNNLDRDLQWREQIIAALRESNLPTVAEVIRCRVEPDTIIDLTAWANNYWFSAFTVRCVARQPRD